MAAAGCPGGLVLGVKFDYLQSLFPDFCLFFPIFECFSSPRRKQVVFEAGVSKHVCLSVLLMLAAAAMELGLVFLCAGHVSLSSVQRR